MKAVKIKEFGPAEGLEVVDIDEPEPGAGQVQIEVEAIGVGGVDAVIRRGTLAAYGFEPGLVPGSEVAGTVTKVGEGADPRLIGSRVWAFVGVGGAYAELAVAKAEDTVVLPEGLDLEDAVTIGGSSAVAHHALEHAHFARGESVLIRGAAGSIGIPAVELARRRGAATIAVTTSDAERGRKLTELGATSVLDRQATGPDTFDVILDLIAGPDIGRFVDKLNPNGRYVVLGAVAGFPPADFGTSLLRNFQRSLSLSTFSADTVPTPELRQTTADHFTGVQNGELHPAVHEVLKLDEAAVAHRKMDDGEVFGRIVLKP
ncbi:MAG TPA: zinc-binding dehydrogenase [Amycolatopsis sp.]|nr:zinc-binding dehydrogenase [Amycolatopsis sp.]